MGNPLDSGQGMGETAIISTSFAACVIPVAWSCAGEMYKMASDPGAMFEAGQEWLSVAGRIGEAVSANENLTNSIGGTGWSGSDYEAFTEKAADLSRQLMVSQVFAITVGIALITMAVALMVAAVTMMIMGLAMAAQAVAILVAAASVVGFLGPVEALEFEAEVFAINCEAGLMSMDATLSTLSATLGSAIGALLAVDVGTQLALGDSQALADLSQATVDGLGTIAAGLTASFYQRAIGDYMKTPFTSTVVRAIGLSDTVNGESITDVLTKPFDPSRK